MLYFTHCFQPLLCESSHQQNRWWLKVILSLCPKLLWSLLPFPALTLTAVISPVSQTVVLWRSRQIKGNQQSTRKAQVVMVKVRVT